MVKKKSKKKKSFDLPFDPKQFPNFLRGFYLCRNKQIIAEVVFMGYLHRIVVMKKASINEFWIEKDPTNEFRKKQKERGPIFKQDQIPNAIQRVHIFQHHDCIGEIDFRGRLEVLKTEYADYTFFVEKVQGKY